jgi:hypothetical protein
MLTVTVEPADNGVVKITYDDSVNGAGEEHISRVVYDFDKDSDQENLLRFLNDLTLDLGIDVGSSLDPYIVEVHRSIGNPKIVPVDKLKEKIKELKQELKRLEAAVKTR